MQFVINELPLLLLCPIGLIYAGMDGLPLTHLILALTLILSLILLYRFIYLKRMTYSVGNEQFVFEYGVFHRKVDYLELYRIVDFNEHLYPAIMRIKNGQHLFWRQNHTPP